METYQNQENCDVWFDGVRWCARPRDNRGEISFADDPLRAIANALKPGTRVYPHVPRHKREEVTR